jgi:hypothetical protein
MSAAAQLNLLNPSSDDLRGHYIHQLKQTILGYPAPQIVVGTPMSTRGCRPTCGPACRTSTWGTAGRT